MTGPGPGPGTGVRDPRERFLRDIAERIPARRIAEIHLFAPLRSGGRESGVAVVAAYAEPDTDERAGSPPAGEGSIRSPDSAEQSVASDTDFTPVDAAAGSPPAGEPNTDSRESADQNASAVIDPVPAPAEAAVAPPPDSHSTISSPDLPDHADSPSIESPRRERLVVYKATYRWTRKGPDRGRWEVDITAEADAPLQAVADVVRGVQRRAGDDSEPELIAQAALRQALSDRPWAAAV